MDKVDEMMDAILSNRSQDFSSLKADLGQNLDRDAIAKLVILLDRDDLVEEQEQFIIDVLLDQKSKEAGDALLGLLKRNTRFEVKNYIIWRLEGHQDTRFTSVLFNILKEEAKSVLKVRSIYALASLNDREVNSRILLTTNDDTTYCDVYQQRISVIAQEVIGNIDKG